MKVCSGTIVASDIHKYIDELKQRAEKAEAENARLRVALFCEKSGCEKGTIYKVRVVSKGGHPAHEYYSTPLPHLQPPARTIKKGGTMIDNTCDNCAYSNAAFYCKLKKEYKMSGNRCDKHIPFTPPTAP